MILIDANLLLYAYDSSSEHHKSAKGWFEEVSRNRARSSGVDDHLAFLRISTIHAPLHVRCPINEALAVVSEWLSHSQRPHLDPTETSRNHEHPLACCPGIGPLVMEAIWRHWRLKHGATLYTNTRTLRAFQCRCEIRYSKIAKDPGYLIQTVLIFTNHEFRTRLSSLPMPECLRRQRQTRIRSDHTVDKNAPGFEFFDEASGSAFIVVHCC